MGRRGGPRRRGAVLGYLALLLCLLLVMAAGCSGEAAAPSASGASGPSSEARLLVSRNFGREMMLDVSETVAPGASVMELLARHATIETGYGGGFVGGINGVKSTFGRAPAGQAADWFYWVDGAIGDVGADYFSLAGEETVWWDYHLWSGTAFIPCTLSAFPRPFAEEPIAWHAPGPLEDELRQWARANGLDLAESIDAEQAPAEAAVLAFSLNTAPLPEWLAEVLARGATAGVFVEVQGGELTALTETGARGAALEAAALAIAHPTAQDQMLLILLGADQDALRQLLGGLSGNSARAKVALGLRQGGLIVLPEEAAAGDKQQ